MSESKPVVSRLAVAAFASTLLLAASSAPISAATCADAFANWSAGSRLVEEETNSVVLADSIDEWDSDVIKIRHNIAGLIAIDAAGAALSGTLYVWNESTESADTVDVESLGGNDGGSLTALVPTGDYCFEAESRNQASGSYDLTVNFTDGCELGTYGEGFCNSNYQP